MLEGMLETSWLRCKSIACKAVRKPSEAGMLPDNESEAMLSDVSAPSPPKAAGRLPMPRPLLLNVICVTRLTPETELHVTPVHGAAVPHALLT